MPPEQVVDVPLTLEPGEWEGEYIDWRGVRGELLLRITPSGDTIQGEYELRLRVRDNPRIYRGRLEGRVEGGSVKFQVDVMPREPAQGVSSRLYHEAQLASGGSFARQAMYGIVRNSPESSGGGGIWIAWRFNKPGAR